MKKTSANIIHFFKALRSIAVRENKIAYQCMAINKYFDIELKYSS